MRNPVIMSPLKFLGANDDEKEIGHKGNAGEENDDFNHLTASRRDLHI